MISKRYGLCTVTIGEMHSFVPATHLEQAALPALRVRMQPRLQDYFPRGRGGCIWTCSAGNTACSRQVAGTNQCISPIKVLYC